MTVLDLFSGIGGFSLGLERTGGFRTAAFCEIDPYCRRVLAKHWPEVPCYDDIRTLTADRLAADGIAPDVICGGFPCQDISFAGHGAGLDGERSSLWFEYARLIGEIRPRYIIVENVSALLVRGLDRVLGSLAALGYDAEWHCIPACAVGAPHIRDRTWIIAYPAQLFRDGSYDNTGSTGKCASSFSEPGNGRDDVAYAQSIRGAERQEYPGWSGAYLNCAGIIGSGWWASEPDVGRVAHGISGRVDRLSALGNAVVPQIPELIGRAILAAVFR